MHTAHFTTPGRVSIIFALVLLPLSASAHETCSAPVAACREQLFEIQDLVAADTACADAVAIDPADGCARMFRSVTRILRVLFGNADGEQAAVFTDSFKEMLDQFGIGEVDRDFYSFGPSVPVDLDGRVALPANSPDGSDVQDTLFEVLLPALQESVADLAAVSPTTVIELTQIELGQIAGLPLTFGIGQDPASVEIDFGETKVLQALLFLWVSQIQLLAATDMDLDLDSYTPIVDAIGIQADVIDENSALGTLLPAQAATLAAANQANRDMLDAFLAASEFIRSETDDQSNDLLTIEPDQLADEAEVRVQIAALRSALDGPTTILNLGTVSLDEQLGIDFLNDSLGTEIDASGAILDLALFYEEHPFDLRGVLPTFDESNGVVADSFPDPTFRGVLTAPAPTSPLLSAASLITLGLLGRVRRAHRIRSAFMSHHH